MNPVVLTGSSGMLGTAIGTRLLTEGLDVVGVDLIRNRWSEELNAKTTLLDLRDPDALDNLPRQPGVILHFAANSRVRESVERPGLAKENIDITFNLLEYARRTDSPRIIFASSREVYGATGDQERSEEIIRLGRSENPYAASKVGSEALVHAYRNCYGVESVVLRFSNVYGRYDVSDRVIPQFVAQALKDEELYVYGSEKVLDFVYLDDCVDGVLEVLDQFATVEGETFNIATAEGTRIAALADHIVDITGSDTKVNVETSREGEVSQFVADIEHSRQCLGYSPSYSLEDGIERTVSWYRDRPALMDEILRCH